MSKSRRVRCYDVSELISYFNVIAYNKKEAKQKIRAGIKSLTSFCIHVEFKK